MPLPGGSCWINHRMFIWSLMQLLHQENVYLATCYSIVKWEQQVFNCSLLFDICKQKSLYLKVHITICLYIYKRIMTKCNLGFKRCILHGREMELGRNRFLTFYILCYLMFLDDSYVIFVTFKILFINFHSKRS